MCEDNSVLKNKPFYYVNIKGLESCAFLTSSNKKGETEKISENSSELALFAFVIFGTFLYFKDCHG